MHPARSIIILTVSSGIGCGMLMLFGFLAPLGAIPASRSAAVAVVALSLVLIVAGFVSSTFHLGHPERAWRALSQWRSSWLSREGLTAIVTSALVAALGLELALGEGLRPWVGGLAYASALSAAAMVVCTAMIYWTLKPIRQWHRPSVLPVYLVLALATGAVWLDVVLDAWGDGNALVAYCAVIFLLCGAALKFIYWRGIDGGRQIANIGTATGLGRFGTVRLFEAPHSADNYLLKEMGFQIARRHAARLRRLVLVAGFAGAALLTILALAATGILATGLAALAAVLATLGAVIERWLFFAEATHTVTLYYGAAGA